MFVHRIELENEIVNEDRVRFAFLKSDTVKVYPCGRRSYINEEDDTNIPFDPESRLNTEFNNRNFVSENGFTKTYIDYFNENELAISLAGYRFNLSHDCENVTEFVNTLIEFLAKKDDNINSDIDFSEVDKIYANIRIQSIPLLSNSGSNKNYYTEVLRDQTRTGDPSVHLDMPVDDTFYFSGLSFSTKPLASIVDFESNNLENKIYSKGVPQNSPLNDSWSSISGTVTVDDETKPYQCIVSLCVFNKSTNAELEAWELYQPSIIPVVAHGDTEGSIKVTNITVEKDISVGGDISTANINATESITYGDGENSLPVSILQVVESPDKPNTYRLQFSCAAKSN